MKWMSRCIGWKWQAYGVEKTGAHWLCSAVSVSSVSASSDRSVLGSSDCGSSLDWRENRLRTRSRMRSPLVSFIHRSMTFFACFCKEQVKKEMAQHYLYACPPNPAQGAWYVRTVILLYHKLCQQCLFGLLQTHYSLTWTSFSIEICCSCSQASSKISLYSSATTTPLIL